MATNKKSTTKKTAAKKVTKTAPKKCATRTCKCKKKDQKNEKHKFIIFGLAVILIILCGSLGAMTWARYAMTPVSGTATAQVAKWSVKVKQGETVITGDEASITLGTPTNSHTDVAAGKIAPGSIVTGSLSIDFTDTEVETEYSIVLTKPSTLAARNAKITATADAGSADLTCVDTNATTVTCTGHLMVADIVSNPIVTTNIELTWDSHDSYIAGDDSTVDTEDGIAAAGEDPDAGIINLGVSVNAKQAFNYGS